MLAASFDLDDTPDTAGDTQSEVDLKELHQECLARARLYRVLAGVFVEEPSADFVAALRDPVFLASLGQLGIVFDNDFLTSDLPVLTDALACEYATLFASSGGFPPIESVRLTGRFKQDPHYQIAQIYQRMGFEQVKGQFEVFPDQLGVELMFVAEMLGRCATALEKEDLPSYRRLDKEIKRFWSLHLGRWVRGYGGLIERAASHSFYRGMASFLVGFAAEEIAAMGLTKLDDLDQGQLVVPKSEISLEFNPDEPVCGECPSGLAKTDQVVGGNRVIPISALKDLAL
jgi:TorA maturation chaperone TorD